MKNFLSIFLVIILANTFYAQDELQFGTGINPLRQTQGGFYDYSDPDAVNIKVSVWGFVRFPGKYIIPFYSNVFDLLSYAGGPTDDANLDDIKIFRVSEDSVQSFIELNYKEFLWGNELTSQKTAPQILTGDILLVPGEERLYFRDYFSIITSVISVAISLAILILNINR
jgi:polysaccharide export outer membrane protein